LVPISDRPLAPLIRALLAQGGAAALVFGTAVGLDLAVPPIGLLAAQGGLAALLGVKLGLPRWWLPINLFLPPLVPPVLALDLPGWTFAAAFLVLVLVQWNSVGERVPLYLTNRRTRAALADLLPEGEGIGFLDLGSGLGGTVIDLARRRPDGRFHGIESAPIPYLVSRIRQALAGAPNATLRWGDFWSEDFSRYDIVYCFLSPEPMDRLFAKACSEMRPGTLLVSNSFDVPDRKPDREIAVDDRRGTRLLLWKF
jgi:hypothetical protein